MRRWREEGFPQAAWRIACCCRSIEIRVAELFMRWKGGSLELRRWLDDRIVVADGLVGGIMTLWCFLTC